MARFHIRRRKRTPAEHALDLAQSAVKLWASTKVVKTAAKRGWKLPFAGALVAGGAIAAKKLRGSSEPQQAYTPPAPYTPPQPDTKMHDKPHGDPATDLPAPGDEAAPRPAEKATAARDEVAPASEST